MGVLRAKVGDQWVDLPVGAPVATQGVQGPPGLMAPLVVKSTQPTAADYGQATIPLNAVWIQAP
jgi:hypothetical protein